MRCRFAFLFALALAGCTAPAYQCGQPVPCARGGVQSCTSRDGTRCRYLASDGTIVECAACTDCSDAARGVAAWCAGADPTTVVGGGADLAAPMSSPDDMTSVAPELGNPPADLADHPTDMSSSSSTDLACHPYQYDCQNDPSCCSECCSGGCNVFGRCSLA